LIDANPSSKFVLKSAVVFETRSSAAIVVIDFPLRRYNATASRRGHSSSPAPAGGLTLAVARLN
jgi:hypothetical protein